MNLHSISSRAGISEDEADEKEGWSPVRSRYAASLGSTEVPAPEGLGLARAPTLVPYGAIMDGPLSTDSHFVTPPAPRAQE